MKSQDYVLSNFPLTCEQGATFNLPIHYKDADGEPIDLTDYVARMQVRKTPGSAGDPILDLDSETKGGITIDGLLGIIEINVEASVTENLDPLCKGSYDLFIESPAGFVERLLAGTFTIIESTTR